MTSGERGRPPASSPTLGPTRSPTPLPVPPSPPPPPRSFCSKDVPGVSSMGLAYQRLQKARGGGAEDQAGEVRGPAQRMAQRACAPAAAWPGNLPARAALVGGPPRGTGGHQKHPLTLVLLPSSTPTGAWDLAVSWEEAPNRPGQSWLVSGGRQVSGGGPKDSPESQRALRGPPSGHRAGGGGGGPQPLLTSPLFALR